MTQALHSVSVAGVIIDDQDRALVIRRRDNGHWEPPGGVLELDESITDGLRREVEEETGLHVSVGPLTGVYKNMSRAIVALVFRCNASGGELRLNPEVSEFRWMNNVEVRDVLDEAYAVRILDAFSNDGAAIRSHNGRNVMATSPSGQRYTSRQAGTL